MKKNLKRLHVFVFAVAVLGFVVVASASSFAANTPADATVSRAPLKHVPTAADLAHTGTSVGDVAEADVYAVGTSLQYTGLVLDGDGVHADSPHPFLKVQSQSGDGNFGNGGCYLGNNSSAGSFGLGFFTLSQPFSSAHMRASRSGSSVTINLTNVNGGALPNQTYVCDGAPTPPGDKIGVLGYADFTSQLDNFSDGSTVLDNFSFTGTLGSTGNWTDVAPGMNANGSRAQGGTLALSFWQASAPCTLTETLSYNSGTLTVGYSYSAAAPAIWGSWLLASGGAQKLFVKITPATPPTTYTVNQPLAPSGTVGVLSLMFNRNGIICKDWKTVNTSPTAPNAK